MLRAQQVPRSWGSVCPVRWRDGWKAGSGWGGAGDSHLGAPGTHPGCRDDLHPPGGLCDSSSLSHGSGGWKSRTKVLAELVHTFLGSLPPGGHGPHTVLPLARGGR